MSLRAYVSPPLVYATQQCVIFLLISFLLWRSGTVLQSLVFFLRAARIRAMGDGLWEKKGMV